MNDSSLMGMREIEQVVIRPLNDITFGGKQYNAGEPLFLFDNLQMMDFQENKARKSANGGYLNQARIIWESPLPMQISFSQGVVSTITMAALGNSKLDRGLETLITKKETLIWEGSPIALKFTPVANSLYAYYKGEKITDFSLNDNFLTFGETVLTNEDIEVYYDFNYTNTSVMHIGQRAIPGFLSLTAHTRLKDDMTGKTVTGIFRIPKLKLMSDFSIRLGEDVPPMIANFRFEAHPTGSKGSETVMDFISLDRDIDSDI